MAIAPLRLASVSYLNAKPLIYGLEDASDDLSLQLDVPARLLGNLRSAQCDVALLPVIDYQRMRGLRIVPAGGIGCDGPTLTVRVFSRTPIERIETLACDPESHTSVALARVILAERYGLRPRFIDLPGGDADRAESRLLIGDKVVCDEPAGFDHQIDLGEEWKSLTGLPFVFAVWMAREGVELGDLPARLEKAKRLGLEHIPEIIQKYAIPNGWPAEVAQEYLTRYLKFDIGPSQLEAIRLFHQLAARHGMIEHEPTALKLV